MIRPSAENAKAAADAGPLKTPTPSVVKAKDVSEVNVRKAIPVLMERPQPSPGQSYAKPVSFSQPSAEATAESIASKYGYTLIWGLPDFHLQGPVTLLGSGVEQDVGLLNKAIGFDGPVYLSVDPASQSIVAAPRGTLSETALSQEQQSASAPALRPLAPSASASQEATSTTAMLESMVKRPAAKFTPAVKSAPAAPVKVAPAVAQQPSAKPVAAWKMTVRAHEHLETALNRYLAKQGYHLNWKVDGGFVSNSSVEFSATSLQSLLYKVLSPLDLSANAYSQSKQVDVFPVNPAAAQ
jgi:hypothetical protein